MVLTTISLKLFRAPKPIRVIGWRSVAIFSLLVLSSLLSASAFADPVKGDVRVSTEGGYARLVFRLDEQIESKVHVSGTVLVIDFKKAIDVSVDRINSSAPAFVSAARRDPDGTAIRIAMVQGFRVNATTAGERLFVDLLPMDWKGVVPGLPQEVIEELARRTREAERQLRQQRLFSKQRNQTMIQVKVGTQPTFTRYVFDLPNFANVVPERSEGKLTLNFDQPIKYDLADAKAAMPKTLTSLDTELEHDSVAVTFVFNGTPDVRLFREDRSVVIDIDNGNEAEKQQKTENGVVQTEPDGGVKIPEVAPPETTAPKKADGPAATPRAEKIVPAAPTLQSAEPATPPPAKPIAKTPASPSAMSANEALAMAKETMAPAAAPPAAVTPAQAPIAAPPVAPKPTAAPDSADAKPAEKVMMPEKAVMSEKATPSEKAMPPEKVMSAEKPAPPEKMMPMAKAEAAAESDAAVKAAPAQAPVAAPAPPSVASPAPSAPKAPVAPMASMAKETAKPDKSATPPAEAARAPATTGTVQVLAARQGDNLRLSLRFPVPTPAAVFHRADVLWMVFDSDSRLDLTNLQSLTGDQIRQVSADYPRPGEILVRIRLERPRLSTLTANGTGWDITIGDTVAEPIAPLAISRNVAKAGRSSAAVPFVEPRQIHRLVDSDAGDKLIVVTALGPARGFVKRQDFVEFRALVSTHGVVVQPLADDITAELSADKVTISRPNGLILSSSGTGQTENTAFRSTMFDSQTWGFDRQADFQDRQKELMYSAANAPESKRRSARLDLARFYLARDYVTEAKAVIDVVLQDQRVIGDDITGVVMKAVANVMLNRPDEALKDLSNPVVGDQQDAPVWRAVAFAKQGKWPEARAGLKASEDLIGAMPVELQRLIMVAALRTFIETRDYTSATRILNDYETIGIPRDLQPEIDLLTGRLNEALGKKDDAVASYRAASDSSDRRAAAQGRLRELMLRYRMDEIKRGDVINELEKLTATWRGDETEAEGLQHLAHFYTEDARYRDAFHVMRVALLAHANSDITRRIHDEAAATFDSLFLGGKGDALPPIEALGLFYDYRDLTPIGRRGDEMIRRLAERLVAVDLLDQASELLDYQVTHRLQGAARAQVATRLAVVYLMNRKPDRALATLRMTRISGLATELRTQRLLLEARALSSIGRHELGLEIIANMKGREVIRLRSDIYWAAKRWREAAEQIELLYGDRWKEFAPLSEGERADILRAGLGYSLAEDALGLAAFREKYAAKMSDGPARRQFEILTGPGGVGNAEFRDTASAVAAQDTLGEFLRAIKAHSPDSPSRSETQMEPPPAVPRELPGMKPAGAPQASAPQTITPASQGTAIPSQPAGAAPKPDPGSTGSISVPPVLPPQPPKGVRLRPVPAPQAGVPRLPVAR